MAWYLNYSYVAAAKYVSVSIPASTSDAGRPLQIEWEIEFEARKNGTEFIVASDSPNTTSALFFIRSGTDFEFRSSGNSNWLVTTGVTTTNWTVFKIRSTFNGTTRAQQLYVNGSLIATRTPTTSAIPAINAFFGLNNNASRYGDFKYFKFTDFVTPANNRLYDANASGGTGDILPETIGGVNGTQAGTWPSDNSEWVSYSSGSAQDVVVPSAQLLMQSSAISVLVAQAVSSAMAQYGEQSSTVAVACMQAVSANQGHQFESATAALVAEAQLIAATNGQQLVQAVQVDISQSGANSQDISVPVAQFLTNAVISAVAQIQEVVARTGEQFEQSQAGYVTQSASITILEAQYAEQSELAALTLEQRIQAAICQQIMQAIVAGDLPPKINAYRLQVTLLNSPFTMSKHTAAFTFENTTPNFEIYR